VDEIECVEWIKSALKIFNPLTYSAVYQFPIPEGWSVERFSLPPDFAKQMTITGVEELRFPPGWGEPSSEEHWSYAYLWWLDGNREITADFLQDNLKLLYSGLLDRNVEPRKIPAAKLYPVTVEMKMVKTEAGDVKTFQGGQAVSRYSGNENGKDGSG
jgi:hypothetical protein